MTFWRRTRGLSTFEVIITFTLSLALFGIFATHSANLRSSLAQQAFSAQLDDLLVSTAQQAVSAIPTGAPLTSDLQKTIRATAIAVRVALVDVTDPAFSTPLVHTYCATVTATWAGGERTYVGYYTFSAA